jgi:RimJ/RimL family protein N-acetyltransferase
LSAGAAVGENRRVTVPEIATARLVLRGWRDSDRAPFAALNADPEVARYLGGGARERAASDALVDQFVEHWRANGFGLWAVERTQDGAVLGFSGLSRPGFEAHFTPAVEVGWRLARAAWGHGYATEAAMAALRFAFEVLDLEEVVSFTVPANARSRRVMERLGMTHDEADDFDHPRLPAGHPLRRHVLYRLRREDWVRRASA